MKYTIFSSEVNLPNGKSAIGLELQPPLDEGVAQAVAQALIKQEVGFTNGTEHIADEAIITRSDSDGTALIVTPNFYGREITPVELAKTVGALIDPCNLHEITITSPLPE